MNREDIPHSAEAALAQGYERLTAQALKLRFVGQCFLGLYRPPFSFVMCADPTGKLWGENNYGTADQGQWAIDDASGVMTVSWQNYWDSHSTWAYSKGREIHQYDVDTGNWRSSFLREMSKQDVEAYQNAPIHLKG